MRRQGWCSGAQKRIASRKTRKAGPLLFALGLGLFGCQRVEVQPQAQSGAPSFVVVTIDTLRADHVGAYGAKTGATPTLDRLAAAGAVFETAIAPVPLTLPSHTSILTGLYPPSHGVRHNGIFRVPATTPTVATALQKAGWKTAAVVGASVLSRDFGLDRGFDHYDDQMGRDRASGSGFPERSATAVTDSALAWLEEVEQPYLLWVHYYDPHAIYAPPKPYLEKYLGQPYDGEIAYVDAELGRLLDRVAVRSDGDRTYVLVTSDHGEGLGEHGEADHSYLIYDADLRVPWIVSGPGVSRARYDDVVSVTSLAPTVLGLAGRPPLERTDVEDLSPVLRGESRASKEESWAYAESLAGRLDHGWSALHGIRSSEAHYLRSAEVELYEVGSDPQQLEDLGSSEAEAHRRVREKAAARLDGLLAEGLPLETVPIDAERRAQIEALGYLVPEALPEVVAINPRDALPFGQLGFQAIDDLLSGRTALALERADQVLERFPDSFRMHDLKARAHLKDGRLDDALVHAKRVVDLLGDRTSAWSLLGAVHTQRGELDEARRAYEAARDRDPDEVDPHLGLLSLAVDHDAKGAEVHASRVLELSKDRPQVAEQVGAIWDRAGHEARAFEIFQRIADHPAASASLHQRLAIQLARRGDDEAAAFQLAQVRPADRKPEFQMHLAIVYAARGNPEQAIPVLEAVLHLTPDHEGARKLLARVRSEPPR